MLASVDKSRHARLQRKHALLLRLAHDLSVENTQLRRREKVMISLLAEQVTRAVGRSQAKQQAGLKTRI